MNTASHDLFVDDVAALPRSEAACTTTVSGGRLAQQRREAVAEQRVVVDDEQLSTRLILKKARRLLPTKRHMPKGLSPPPRPSGAFAVVVLLAID